MGFGKTIELYLANGTFDGIVTAELSNWNGKAIKISRNEVGTCEREDVVYSDRLEHTARCFSARFPEIECIPSVT